MSTYIFESSRGEIRITVIAADITRAEQELDRRISQLQESGVVLVPVSFILVSSY